MVKAKMSNPNPFVNASMPMPDIGDAMPQPQTAMPQPQAIAVAQAPVPEPTPQVTTEPDWKAEARQIELDDIEAEMNRQIDEFHAQEILAKKNKANDAESKDAADERAQAAAEKINKSLRGKDQGMKTLERVGITSTLAGVGLYAIYAIPAIQWLLSVIGGVLLLGGVCILGYLLAKDKNRQNKILAALKQGYEDADAELKAARISDAVTSKNGKTEDEESK